MFEAQAAAVANLHALLAQVLGMRLEPVDLVLIFSRLLKATLLEGVHHDFASLALPPHVRPAVAAEPESVTLEALE